MAAGRCSREWVLSDTMARMSPEIERFIIVSAVVVTGILAVVVGRLAVRGARRRRLLGEPFPAEWEQILQRNVALYSLLPSPLQEQLQARMKVFLGERRFEGCGGLEITDEIRVTVAAQACMLLLNRPTRYYSGLSSILVYPGAYVAKTPRPFGGWEEGRSGRLGESWTRGSVVLAWDHVRQRASEYRDGQNLVFHEFAHQLDQEDGVADGIPGRDLSAGYLAWGRLMHREYLKLQRSARRGTRDVLDEYGATNPAEFFAVATEAFFEKPAQLARRRPKLYEALKECYRVDPRLWMRAAGA